MLGQRQKPLAQTWAPLPRAWVLEALLLAALLMLFVTAMVPGQTPETSWRLRMQQAVVVERLVGLGFDRGQVSSTVEALTPQQVENVARNVGTPYRVSTFVGLLCGLLLFGLLGTLLILWV